MSTDWKFDSYISNSPSPHVEVFLGKILNHKLFLKAVPVGCECVYVNVH